MGGWSKRPVVTVNQPTCAQQGSPWGPAGAARVERPLRNTAAEDGRAASLPGRKQQRGEALPSVPRYLGCTKGCPTRPGRACPDRLSILILVVMVRPCLS